jgi:XTP/dITP diphosphohydrolase
MEPIDTPLTLVIATRNPGKTLEIRELLKGFPIAVKNLDDFGTLPEAVEDGETFDENAYKKSSFYARILGMPALADDSGLCVEALGGAPGVYSARYAGENATDAQNCEKLLKEMNGKTDRRAAFHCVISLAVPTGAALTYEGRCDGVLLESPRGENGFGYDPLFLFPEFNQTFAEIPQDQKGRVSHRGKALREMREEFDKVITWINLQMPVDEKFNCTT